MKKRMPRRVNGPRPARPVALIWIALVPLMVGATSARAADYQPSAIPGWQKILFDGETLYQPQDGCIRAEADGSASGLIRELRQPLGDGARLSWAWRADDMLEMARPAAEKTRGGDDFLARVYVIHEGFFFWQTKAINYVWSRQHPVGESWPNPFTGNAVMVSVQSGSDGLGSWHRFERDVKADFKQFHNLEVDRIDAVAIMADADNTGGYASACYRQPELSVSR